ncbi:MAG: PAS domain S-box protein [Acidimicrobiales bacterium]|nr:PAS domain S-box protein [Acidimicrobiales bacterium]
MLPTTMLPTTRTTAPTPAQLLAALPQALIATDLDGRVTWWTGAAEALYGWSAGEAVGRPVSELIVPEPIRDHAARLRGEALSGTPYAGHFTLCRKDGSTFPAHVMNSPVCDEDGVVVGLLGIAHDSTEALAATQALAEREARYRGIVDTSLEGIWMLDPDGRTTFANRRLGVLLGVGPDELAVSTVFDFVRPENHAGVRRVLGELRRGDSAQFETSLIRGDGTEVPVDLVASSLRDDHGVHLGALAMVADATERQASLAALRAQEERFRQVFDQGPLGGAIVGLDGRIQRANTALCRLLGYDAKELEGRTVEDITHPEDIATDLELLERLSVGEISDYQLEKRYRRRDGSVLVGRLTVTLVRTAEGEPLHAIGQIEDVTATAEAARTIAEQQERLTRTLEAGGMAAWEIDLDTGAYTVADNLSAVFGTSPDLPPEATLEEFISRVHADDLDLFLAAATEEGHEGAPDGFAVEYRVEKHGGEAWMRTQGEFVRDASGRTVAIRGISTDVAEQRRHQELRSEAAEVYRRIVEASSDAFVGADPSGLITDWNPAAAEMFGWAAAEVVGTSLVDHLFPEGDRALYRAHLAALLPEGGDDELLIPERMEVTARHRSGWLFPVEVSMVTVRQGGQTEVRAFVRDITERRAHETELTERALTDQLTGLPNRTLLADRLATAISAIGRRGRGAAVLFIDVDRFKVVNDSLGHRTGDNLLVALADRLRTSVRPDDTVARLGGDEFVVLCQDLEHQAEAVEVAERIFSVLEEPFVLGTRVHRVDVSIGIAHAESSAVEAEDLLRDADVAMYQAKAAGGGRIEVFTTLLRERARRRLDLEDELRTALAHEHLQAHYQPVRDLAAVGAGGIVGFEALVRWHHPARGVIEPGEFIGVAEETGLISPLGELVLDQACAQVAAWRRRPRHEHLTMAVNLSGRQLTEPGVAEIVDAILRRHDLPASALCLEITESMLMADSAAAAASLHELHDLGVTLAVDDFGTGYSSLLYLRRFPVGILKLDRAFVSGLGSNGADEAIVGSMIDLAHSLGMTAVAEGVETPGQLAALRRLGCDHAQGYLWSAPVAAATADRLLEHG